MHGIVLCIVIRETLARDKKEDGLNFRRMYYSVLDEVSRDTQRSGREIERTYIRLYAPHQFTLNIFICISLALIIPQFVRSTLSALTVKWI